MTRRDRHAQGDSNSEDRFDVRTRRHVECNGCIQMSSRKLIGDGIGSSDKHLQGNTRMLVSYVSEKAWTEVAAEALHHADGHMAALQAFQFLKMCLDAVLGPAPTPDLHQDCFPGRSQPHPIRQTLEECDTQLSLEV